MRDPMNHRRTIAGLLMLLWVAVLSGCGGSGSGSTAGGGGTAPPTAPPAAPPAFSGRLMTVPVLVVPEPQRAGVVQSKAEVEALGYQVLGGDGQFVVFPQAPAAGWTAELGSQRVVVGTDGSFSFEPPSDGATRIVFHHPSLADLAYQFTVAELGQFDAAGSPVLLTLFFDPCKMGTNDELCGGPSAARERQARARPPGVPADPATVRPPKLFHQAARLLDKNFLGTQEFGTKPNPNVGVDECPSSDGIIPPTKIPFHYLNYLGSTCDSFVVIGGCVNENALSDPQYLVIQAAFLGQIGAGGLGNVPLSLPTRVPGLQENVHCYQNHKHRSCSMINVGDLACALPGGQIVRPTDRTPARGFVAVGASSKIIVHNNGVYGVTKIRKIKDDLKGTLSGDGLVNNFQLQEIRHYTPLNYVPSGLNDATAYFVDRVLEYKPGANAQPGQEDVYEFIVDDRSVEITFRLLGPGLYELPPGDYLGVNSVGTVVYSSPEGLFLKVFGGEPVRLSPAPSAAAALNTLDDVIFRDEAAGEVVFRSHAGGELTVTPPEDSRDPKLFKPLFLNDGLNLVNDGPIAVGTYQNASGQIDAWINGTTNETEGKTLTNSINLAIRIHPRVLGVQLAGLNNERVLVGNSQVILGILTTVGEFFIPGFFQDPVPFEEIVKLEGYDVNFRLRLNDGVLDPMVISDIGFDRRTGASSPPSPSYLDLNNSGHILVQQGSTVRIEPGSTLGLASAVALNDADEVAGGTAAGTPALSSGGSVTPLDSVVESTIQPGFPNPGGFSWVGTRMLRGKFAVVRGGNDVTYLLFRK